MKNDKSFTAVGITTQNGQTKIRFGNDMAARIKIFNKKCERVDFVELPSAMTKVEALEWLQANHADKLVGDAGAAVTDKLADLAREAKKGEVKVQARAPKAPAVQAAEPQAESAE